MPTKLPLTESDIMRIPDLLLRGMRQRQIGSELGISQNVVGRIMRGEAHRHHWPVLRKKLKAVRRELDRTRLCTKCGKRLPKTAEYFQPLRKSPWFEARCLECKRAASREHYARDRDAAFEYYSWGDVKCACCGETRREFLSIDHIDGGGTAHRREFRGRYASIYQWLRANDYPEGFQVLCMNCNSSIGFYGYCPHQRERGE